MGYMRILWRYKYDLYSGETYTGWAIVRESKTELRFFNVIFFFT